MLKAEFLKSSILKKGHCQTEGDNKFVTVQGSSNKPKNNDLGGKCLPQNI